MKRVFDNFSSYSEYYHKHFHKMNDVDVVLNELTVCADGEFSCKSWKVALRRFFKLLCDDDRFDGWFECISECIQNGCWKETATIFNPCTLKEEYVKGGFHWCVEFLDDDRCYIELTVPIS